MDRDIPIWRGWQRRRLTPEEGGLGSRRRPRSSRTMSWMTCSDSNSFRNSPTLTILSALQNMAAINTLAMETPTNAPTSPSQAKASLRRSRQSWGSRRNTKTASQLLLHKTDWWLACHLPQHWARFLLPATAMQAMPLQMCLLPRQLPALPSPTPRVTLGAGQVPNAGVWRTPASLTWPASFWRPGATSRQPCYPTKPPPCLPTTIA
mmetsp:Transcript_40479/g.114645  ORF Transcript_40479/g.114645 Transcript_40479/m.114645 type:complete len:207 (+) Transcript_40479:494-1114(+)